jgi:1,4-dihydroxy-2-naphthoate octaprenyltransferase
MIYFSARRPNTFTASFGSIVTSSAVASAYSSVPAVLRIAFVLLGAKANADVSKDRENVKNKLGYFMVVEYILMVYCIIYDADCNDWTLVSFSRMRVERTELYLLFLLPPSLLLIIISMCVGFGFVVEEM